MTIYQFTHPQYQNIILSDRPGKELLKAIFGLDSTELLLGTMDKKSWTLYLERDSVKRDGKWQKRI